MPVASAVEKSRPPADPHGEAAGPESTPVPARARLAALLEKRIPLLKTGEERYVLGVVLDPETVDTQNDIYSAAEVRDAAPGSRRSIGTWASCTEVWSTTGEDPRVLYRAGVVPVSTSPRSERDLAPRGAHSGDEFWLAIKSAELTGFSIGGSAATAPAAREGG